MSDQTINCDRCNSVAPAGASTCPNCGAPLGSAEETIVTGYETRKLEDLESDSTRIVPEEPDSAHPQAAKTLKVDMDEEPAVARSAPPAAAAFDLPPAAPEAPAAPPPKKNNRLPLIGGICALILFCCMCLPLCIGVVYYVVMQGNF